MDPRARPIAPSPPHHQTSATTGGRKVGFIERHATGLTVIVFLGVSAGLGVAPVPPELKPVDLSTTDARDGVLERVFKKPRMTFAVIGPAGLDEEDEVDESDSDDDLEEPGTSPGEAPASPGSVAEPGAGDPELVAVAPGTAPPPTPQGRVGQKVTQEVRKLRRIARKVKAPGKKLENPCVRHAPDGCAATALDPFFQELDEVDRGTAGARAKVITLGNSLVASDHVTDIVRERLVERFGDGGRGYLLADRLSKVAGRRVRTGRGTPGWVIHTFAQKPPKRAHFGFSGSHHESSKKGDRIAWRLDGASSAQLFWLDHEDAGGFRLEVDGEVIARVDSEKPAVPVDRVMEVDLPAGAEKLRLIAEGKHTVVYGVALERTEPGVTWDTLGVPASDAAMYVNKTDPEIYARQLAERDPTLMVFMLGGNEVRSLAFGWITPEQVRSSFSALIDRTRDAVPEAACLAVAPIDAAKATAAGAKLTTRAEVDDVVAIEREVALEKGCAFFNMWEAMGATGSLHRFRRKGMVNDDLVHPKGKGGDVLGQLFADALLASYVETPVPSGPLVGKRRVKKPRLLGLAFAGPVAKKGEGPAPLGAVSAALGDVADNKRRDPVMIGLFGDEHVAGAAFADRVRERMVTRFGGAGRGWVAVAGPDKSLLGGRVTRKLSGDARVADGRDVVLGGAMGMSGTTARLGPGSRFDLSFCDGCSDPPVLAPGELVISWLHTPDMGTADIYVNDVVIGKIGPEDREGEGDVQFRSIPVRGERHTVTLQVRERSYIEGRAPGPVNVFAVSGGLQRGGVVVDPVGLDGTTAMTMQRWRQDLLRDQIAARDYDLVVAGWGTLEASDDELDVDRYRADAERTLSTLLGASPDADCVVMGPMPVGVQPSLALVEGVQADLAARYGCARFSPTKAWAAAKARSKKAPSKSKSKAKAKAKAKSKRVAFRPTKENLRTMADVFARDVLAWQGYLTDHAFEEPAIDAPSDAAKQRPSVAKGKAGDRKTISLKPFELEIDRGDGDADGETGAKGNDDQVNQTDRPAAKRSKKKGKGKR